MRASDVCMVAYFHHHSQMNKMVCYDEHLQLTWNLHKDQLGK